MNIFLSPPPQVLKKNCPHIVVGTPGRILALARQKSLNLKNIKHFILDECDKMLEALGTSHARRHGNDCKTRVVMATTANFQTLVSISLRERVWSRQIIEQNSWSFLKLSVVSVSRK